MQATHQIHPSINNSPRQVATQSADEYRSDLNAVCRYNTQRAGIGKDHYQPKQNLRYSLHWLENWIE